MIKNFLLKILSVILLIGCSDNHRTAFVEDIDCYSDFSTVDWDGLRVKYYRPNTADWPADVAEYIEGQCRLIMEELPTLIARQQNKIDKLNQRLDPLTATWLEIKERLDEDPENAETLFSQGRLDERIDTILNEIIARNDFMKSLKQCYAQIAKSGIV